MAKLYAQASHTLAPTAAAPAAEGGAKAEPSKPAGDAHSKSAAAAIGAKAQAKHAAADVEKKRKSSPAKAKGKAAKKAARR